MCRCMSNTTIHNCQGQHGHSIFPTGNEQGRYYFLSLHTGKRVVRNNWTVLPMLAEVITTVHHNKNSIEGWFGIFCTLNHTNSTCGSQQPNQNGGGGIEGETKEEPHTNSDGESVTIYAFMNS